MPTLSNTVAQVEMFIMRQRKNVQTNYLWNIISKIHTPGLRLLLVKNVELLLGLCQKHRPGYVIYIL